MRWVWLFVVWFWYLAPDRAFIPPDNLLSTGRIPLVYIAFANCRQGWIEAGIVGIGIDCQAYAQPSPFIIPKAKRFVAVYSGNPVCRAVNYNPENQAGNKAQKNTQYK
jgi:hypothetical protein